MIIDPAVERYCAVHTTAPAGFLAALEEETRASLPMAQMLTGALEGRLLELLVWASGARRVLEVGTYSGYGALSLAGGLASGGRVTTLERDPERAAFARQHVAASPLADRVEVLEGDAVEAIERLEPGWDLAFIDADKDGYPRYYELLLGRLAPRGLLVLDNTLRSGTVLDPGDDATARILADLNAAIAGDPRVVAVLLPVRDGVTVVRRAG